MAAAALGGIVLLVFGGKWIPPFSPHCFPADDAYVNSYATFVAPRVTGQVTEVLVADRQSRKERRCPCSA